MEGNRKSRKALFGFIRTSRNEKINCKLQVAKVSKVAEKNKSALYIRIVHRLFLK